MSKGSLTLAELISYVTSTCAKDWNDERSRLVNRLNATVGTNAYYQGRKVGMNKARGSDVAGYITDATHIRAALLVLLQHSLVTISGGKNKESSSSAEGMMIDPSSVQSHYTYTFLADRATLLPRYPRYIQHVKDVMDDHAGSIVETLLLAGRMRAEDAIASVWEIVIQGMGIADDDDDEAYSETSKHHDNAVDSIDKDLNDDEEPSLEEIEAFFSDSNPKPDAVSSINNNASKNRSRKHQALNDIVATFRKLTEAGYIEAIKPIATTREMQDLQNAKEKELEDGIQGGEVEFDIDDDGLIASSSEIKKRKRSSNGIDTGSRKKKKYSQSNYHDEENEESDYAGSQCKLDDPEIVTALEPLRKLIPLGSVYRVNTNMCHASIRSMVLARVCSEFYGPPPMANKNTKQDESLLHVGGIITAALTFTARQEHAPLGQILGNEESEEDRHRRMAEWGAFTPSDIAPYLPPETTKALQSMVGGTLQNLSSLLVRMADLRYPPIVVEVEDSRGHPDGGKFEVCTRQLMQRLRDRILHRIITSRHGLVAARIVSILQVKGHMESDAIAEDAMVPAKEAREILHRLARDNYVNLFDMHMTKTHNSGTAIYLWHVIDDRLVKAVTNDVHLAILHLRLRRQHEVEVGKDWMDRAKEAGAVEENAHEQDKKRYTMFCKGLERLDCALLQLDETLMALKDL